MTDQAAVMERKQVLRVSASMRDLVRRDVSGLSEEAFLAVYDDVATLGRLTDTLRARVAGDLARRSTPDLPGGGLARRQGFGNAASMVASVTGGSAAGAWRAIEAGRALIPEPALPSDPSLPSPGDPSSGTDHSDQPSTPPAPRYSAIAEASLAGELSVDAAGIITAGLESIADRVPSDQLHALERRLVGKVVRLGVREVRRLVASAVARADLAGHEEREKRQYGDRYLTWSEDHTGMVTLSGRLDPVTAAPLRTVIEQMVTHQFRQRRDQDPQERDQRTVGQMRADALHDLARHALGCKETNSSGVRTTIIVRMNLTDLNTGQGLGSIDGTSQPVSVGELRRLAGEAGIIPAVLGGDSETLNMGRSVRMFTRAQRLALLERDGGCAKCHAPPEHCEAHHIDWWDNGGRTNLTNGVMLCTRCHHDVHRQGWEILVRAGCVDFVPPPQINPTRRARPGGLAAIEVGELDRPPRSPWEDSAWDGHPPPEHPGNDYPPPHDAWHNSVDWKALARSH